MNALESRDISRITSYFVQIVVDEKDGTVDCFRAGDFIVFFLNSGLIVFFLLLL